MDVRGFAVYVRSFSAHGMDGREVGRKSGRRGASSGKRSPVQTVWGRQKGILALMNTG